MLAVVIESITTASSLCQTIYNIDYIDYTDHTDRQGNCQCLQISVQTCCLVLHISIMSVLNQQETVHVVLGAFPSKHNLKASGWIHRCFVVFCCPQPLSAANCANQNLCEVTSDVKISCLVFSK